MLRFYSDEWVEIPGYPMYCVNRSGEILSVRTGKVLIPFGNYTNEYLNVRLSGQCVYVHRIVALTFIPNPEGKPQVHHIDNDPRNNKADNLEWVTPGEHAKRHKSKPWKQTDNGVECPF